MSARGLQNFDSRFRSMSHFFASLINRIDGVIIKVCNIENANRNIIASQQLQPLIQLKVVEVVTQL